MTIDTNTVISAAWTLAQMLPTLAAYYILASMIMVMWKRRKETLPLSDLAYAMVVLAAISYVVKL